MTALSSWYLRIEVAKDRDAEARMGCARHCEKTALLAGCLYAVGARKGMSVCEERMMVSPAFMRSITARDRVRVLVEGDVVCSSEVGRPMPMVLGGGGAGLPLTVQPSLSLTDFLCLPVWGERCPSCFVRGSAANLRRMTRALLSSPRARSNFHETPTSNHLPQCSSFLVSQ